MDSRLNKNVILGGLIALALGCGDDEDLCHTDGDPNSQNLECVSFCVKVSSACTNDQSAISPIQANCKAKCCEDPNAAYRCAGNNVTCGVAKGCFLD
jgi:hypothetical protein